MNNEDLDFFKNLVGDLSEGFGYDYNIFCCQQAIIIANALETKERIVEFHKADWEEQMKMVPMISSDHSGNTFGMSCRLALCYLPQLKVNNRDEKIETIIK